MKVLASEIGPYVETLIRRYRQHAQRRRDVRALRRTGCRTRSSSGSPRSRRSPASRRPRPSSPSRGHRDHEQRLRLSERCITPTSNAATRATILEWAAQTIDRLARRDIVPVVGARDPSHDARDPAGRSGAVPQHRLPFPRDAGVPAIASSTMWDLKLVELRGEHGSVEGQSRGLRAGALQARPGQVLLHQQGRAAAEGALEEYDGWISGLRRDQSPMRADTPIVEAQLLPSRQRGLEDPPAGALDAATEVDGLRHRARHPDAPAVRAGLPFDRLLAVHPTGERRRGRARRTLGGVQQDRVRHPFVRSRRTVPKESEAEQ